MFTKIVTFLRSDSEWLPHIGDYDTYNFRYTIIDGGQNERPEVKLNIQEQSVKVKISRSTQKQWGLIKPDPNLDKIMFQYAIDMVSQKIQNDTLRKDEEVVLYQNAPRECPYDPEMIQIKFDTALEFQVIRPFGFNTQNN